MRYYLAATILLFVATSHARLSPLKHPSHRASSTDGPTAGYNASYGSYLTYCSDHNLVYLSWQEFDCTGNHTETVFPLNHCVRQNGGDGDSSYTASCTSESGETLSSINNYYGTACEGESFLKWTLPTTQCVNWNETHPIGTPPASVATAENNLHQSDMSILHSKAPIPAGWQVRENLKIEMDMKVPMFIGLKRKNLEKLEKIVLQVSDPMSSKYGAHLTSSDVRELVSPSSEALGLVFDWLKSSVGINQSEVSLGAHADSMKILLTRRQIAALLNVEWRTYQELQKPFRRVIKALDAVQIPTALLDIVEAISGHRSWPLLGQETDFVASNRHASLSNITPEILWATYGMNSSTLPKLPSGVRNVQAFVQIGPDSYSEEDLNQFCATYLPSDFPQCNITKSIGGKDGTNYGDESQLDSQYLLTMGYGSETWVYTEPNYDFCHDLMSWSHDVFGLENSTHPNSISFSAGGQCRPNLCQAEGAHRLNGDTMKMAAMGISVFFASGDLGSGQFCRDHWNGGYLSPSFPADLPYVTAVGSTQFAQGTSGEQVGVTFSGGGFSWNFAAFESSKSAVANYFEEMKSSNSSLPNGWYASPTTARPTPDVSALGENFLIIIGGQPFQIGGTSASAPSLAGIVTLLNNIRLRKGKTLGWVNPLFYGNPEVFVDVLKGSNDQKHNGAGWSASKGWDPVTGLGTPYFPSLQDLVLRLNEKEYFA